MKKTILALVAAKLALAAAAADVAEPVTTLELKPSAENCRNSEGDFALLKDGRVLFVYSHYVKGTGGDHDPAHLASRVSADGGRSWSAADELVVANEGGMNVMSVSTLRLKDGSLALFYLRKDSEADCRPVMRVSKDEGKTWGEPRVVIPDADVGYYVMNNCRALRLASGRIVLPVALHESRDGRLRSEAMLMCWLSDDDGLTWRRSKDRFYTDDAAGRRVVTQEPGAVELRDGRVLLYARTDAGRQYFYYSSDGGDTWTKGEPGSLFGPLAPATVLRLGNGDLVAVWNDHEHHPEYTKAGPKWAKGVRAPLTLAISKDDGKTWPIRRTLESDMTGWYCYIAALELDGNLLLGYCARDNLRHSRLKLVPLDWLYAAKDRVAAVTTATAGEVELACAKPAGWRFALSSEKRADGREEVTVRLSADHAAVPPAFELLFSVSGANARHVWTCFDPYAPINPNHFAKYRQSSQLANGMPLAVAFDENGKSVVAMASTEVFEKTFYSLAFNDHTCALEGKMKFFSANPAPRKVYEAKLLIDRRGGDWCETVQAASAWISETAGLKPAAVPEGAYDALYSTWYAYWQDVRADRLEREAALAAACGMKTMILDDGWQMEKSRRYYSKTGDWQPVAARFPDMKEHVAKVHAQGLKYMLWFSVPFVGEESAAYPRFKGKYLNYAGAACGAWVLDLRFPEVRQYLIDTYVKAVRDWGFDGLKLDFIDRFVLPAKDPAVAEDYAGRDFRSVPEATDRLMKDVLAALKAVRPEVLVEFRQRYMGPAMLQYGNMMRALDCPADPVVNRRRIADLRLTSGPLAVHADMLMWCPDDDQAGAAHPILSALFGVVQYSMVLARLPEAHREVVRHWIRFAERHREALLKGRFTARHPELGYTILESESDAERVTAVYAGDTLVRVKADKPVWLVNGSREDGVLVDFGAASAKVKVFDTVGRPVGAPETKTGLVRLAVPKSGYAEIGK